MARLEGLHDSARTGGCRLLQEFFTASTMVVLPHRSITARSSCTTKMGSGGGRLHVTQTPKSPQLRAMLFT